MNGLSIVSGILMAELTLSGCATTNTIQARLLRGDADAREVFKGARGEAVDAAVRAADEIGLDVVEFTRTGMAAVLVATSRPEFLHAGTVAAIRIENVADGMTRLRVVANRVNGFQWLGGGQAERWLGDMLKRESVVADWTQARAAWDRGDPAEAATRAQAVLRGDPRHWRAWALAARALERLGEPEIAGECARRALAIHPGLPAMRGLAAHPAVPATRQPEVTWRDPEEALTVQPRAALTGAAGWGLVYPAAVYATYFGLGLLPSINGHHYAGALAAAHRIQVVRDAGWTLAWMSIFQDAGTGVPMFGAGLLTVTGAWLYDIVTTPSAVAGFNRRSAAARAAALAEVEVME
jgi:tetratricopeptide (TPR) repeat protein